MLNSHHWSQPNLHTFRDIWRLSMDSVHEELLWFERQSTEVLYFYSCFLFRGTVFHSKQENQWSLLFMGADPSVVRRTQYHGQQKSGKSPIQYGAYFCMKNFVELIGLFIFSLFLGILAPFKCGRYLLKKVCTWAFHLPMP